MGDSIIEALKSYKKELVNASGIVYNIDGIECYGLAGILEKISFLGKAIYRGVGKAIFVDRNHDLSYYISGSDWTNPPNYYSSSKKYCYEWGGRKTFTAKTFASLGYGLYNTNTLLKMNLKPEEEEFTVWDKIKEFRESHSDNWFLPSKDELDIIYKVRSNLNNLSESGVQSYWSSSEVSSLMVWCRNFKSGEWSDESKGYHLTRTRLCVQY